MVDRLAKIIEIARNNAKVGIDQSAIEDYEDNMHDSIAEEFPDWTSKECSIADEEFKKVVLSSTEPCAIAWKKFWKVKD